MSVAVGVRVQGHEQGPRAAVGCRLPGGELLEHGADASVRFVVWGVNPVGAMVGGLVGARFGIVTALWVAVAGQALAVLPVLLSPLLRMRDLPRGLDVHAGPVGS